MAPRTTSVCPLNFWWGIITDTFCFPTVGEDIINYWVQLRLNFHPTTKCKIITDNNAVLSCSQRIDTKTQKAFRSKEHRKVELVRFTCMFTLQLLA
ncbi:uncharacterized protein BJ212DRAFT_1329890 [Suillus subaureus]|uniref:Uncharacterized protein n=1 Tax=Suillus subaureus TaxID=48587 RepID=A0A9P7JHJ0_9AGAM|nr:uncharacterized protein BJ212DRAFT_1329890 [Suillus subaureus]KAG1822688.1 hypothetical protein BJ212DRAFT_1329890 [Suillus subaureus]